MAATAEVVEAGHSYSREEFMRRTGLGPAAMRTARRNGLRVRYVGGRMHVLGSDWLQYLDEHGADEYRPT